MSVNQRLAITIPTYNRADFLDYSLEVHIPIMQVHNIPIYISDNASTDNTRLIVEKWQQVYPYIYYHRNDENLGPDKNFELALKMPTTDYVWLLGDTYQITSDSLNRVLQNSEDFFDAILVNISNEVLDVKSQIYTEKNKLLVDLFWLMTCLSVLVYSRGAINNANFRRYFNTNFIQTCVIFEYISYIDFKVSWNQDVSVMRVDVLTNGQNKTTWRSSLFKIWYENRANAIFSLPPQYKLENKLKALMYDGSARSALSVKGLLSLRSEGLFSYNVYKKNYYFLSLISKTPMFLIYLTSVFPVSLIKLLKFIYKRPLHE